MGCGAYAHEAHEAMVQKRTGAAVEEVFRQRGCHALMNPNGVLARESRDSAAHPRSLAIAFALDVTGSMGEIPVLMATKVLPQFMKILLDVQVPDPQVLFLAIGDAHCDRAPLQVGQFESTAELMDQWLTWTYLEGGGGGNGGESYELALYFLAMHTALDCREKRGKRGYLFMTGDDNPFPTLSRHTVETLVGDRLDEDLTVEEVVAKLQETFVPFFIIPDQARRRGCERRWRDVLGDHVLCMDSPDDVCAVAAGALALCERVVPDLDALGKVFHAAGIPGQRVKSAARALKSLSTVIA
jgi:hypothetical protein